MAHEARAPAAGYEVKVGGARADDPDDSKPSGDRPGPAPRNAMTDIANVNVAGHGERDSALLDVQQGKARGDPISSGQIDESLLDCDRAFQ